MFPQIREPDAIRTFIRSWYVRFQMNRADLWLLPNFRRNILLLCGQKQKQCARLTRGRPHQRTSGKLLVSRRTDGYLASHQQTSEKLLVSGACSGYLALHTTQPSRTIDTRPAPLIFTNSKKVCTANPLIASRGMEDSVKYSAETDRSPLQCFSTSPVLQSVPSLFSP